MQIFFVLKMSRQEIDIAPNCLE